MTKTKLKPVIITITYSKNKLEIETKPPIDDKEILKHLRRAAYNFNKYKWEEVDV